MSWWLENPDKWQHEVKEMAIWFPTSQWRERVQNGKAERYWEVITEPVPLSHELPLIIADLDRDGWVDMEPSGRIRHSQHCHAEHSVREGFKNIEIHNDAFLIELTYREPPALPQARCLIPNWSKLILPDHEHFYNGAGYNIICPLFPPDNTWQWRKNTAVDYMTYVSIWVLKTVIWLAAKEKLGKNSWIGSYANHSLEAVLKIDREQNCPCGSGLKFKQCHMPQYVLAYNQQIRQRRLG